MISLEKAKKALEASEKKARALSTAVTTIIVDEHGTLIAASKMDGAIVISPTFAKAKAYTAASFGSPTEDLAQFAGEGKPYTGFTHMSKKFTVIAGGVPVMIDGKLVGGVGVGGSMDVSQDAMCAMEAKKILED